MSSRQTKIESPKPPSRREPNKESARERPKSSAREQSRERERPLRDQERPPPRDDKRDERRDDRRDIRRDDRREERREDKREERRGDSAPRDRPAKNGERNPSRRSSERQNSRPERPHRTDKPPFDGPPPAYDRPPPPQYERRPYGQHYTPPRHPGHLDGYSPPPRLGLSPQRMHGSGIVGPVGGPGTTLQPNPLSTITAPAMYPIGMPALSNQTSLRPLQMNTSSSHRDLVPVAMQSVPGANLMGGSFTPVTSMVTPPAISPPLPTAPIIQQSSVMPLGVSLQPTLSSLLPPPPVATAPPAKLVPAHPIQPVGPYGTFNNPAPYSPYPVPAPPPVLQVPRRVSQTFGTHTTVIPATPSSTFTLDPTDRPSPVERRRSFSPPVSLEALQLQTRHATKLKQETFLQREAREEEYLRIQSELEKRRAQSAIEALQLERDIRERQDLLNLLREDSANAESSMQVLSAERHQERKMEERRLKELDRTITDLDRDKEKSRMQEVILLRKQLQEHSERRQSLDFERTLIESEKQNAKMHVSEHVRSLHSRAYDLENAQASLDKEWVDIMHRRKLIEEATGTSLSPIPGRPNSPPRYRSPPREALVDVSSPLVPLEVIRAGIVQHPPPRAFKGGSPSHVTVEKEQFVERYYTKPAQEHTNTTKAFENSRAEPPQEMARKLHEKELELNRLEVHLRKRERALREKIGKHRSESRTKHRSRKSSQGSSMRDVALHDIREREQQLRNEIELTKMESAHERKELDRLRNPSHAGRYA